MFFILFTCFRVEINQMPPTSKMPRVPFTETSYGGYILPEKIGLSDVPAIFAERTKEDGFVLNILAIGRRSLGTSTLMNALFAAPLVSKSRSNEFETTVNEVEENGVRLKVTVTTYHGDDYSQVLNLIHEQFDDYYEKEQGINTEIEDKRYHVCLCILPFDDLRSNEMNGITEISKICNLIPVITRADAYMEEELEEHRERIKKRLEEDQVEVFTGAGQVGEPESEANDNSESVSEECVRWPMATVASEKTYEIQGVVVRGRKYPWGFIDTASEKHSDFKRLQRMLIQNCYCELHWRTDTKYYNEYRREKLKRGQGKLERRKYEQMLSEMEDILNLKHRMTLDELKREEEMLDAYFPQQSVTKEEETTDKEEGRVSLEEGSVSEAKERVAYESEHASETSDENSEQNTSKQES